jgi:hypothetical protein
MKTLTKILGAACIAMATLTIVPVNAGAQEQMSRKEIREAKKQVRDNKKELYQKSDRLVRKEAKRLEKEGWKTMNMPIEKQLQQTWERQWLSDAEGYPKFIVKEGMAIGQSYSAAQMQAENIAKIRIASDIGSSIATLADVALANQELTPEQAVSLSKAVENSKLLVAQKLGRVFTSQNLYRMKNKNTYEVRVVLMYDMRQALELAHSIVMDQAKHELEELSLKNGAELDKIMGLDKIADSYLSNNYDETL